MKKIIAFVVFSLLAAAQAFAGDSITMTSDLTSTSSKAGLTLYGDKTDATASTATLIGKTSTGVSLGIKSGAGGYAAITQHKSGNRAIASSFNSTSIYYQDVTNVGTAVLTVPTKTDDSDFASWKTM